MESDSYWNEAAAYLFTPAEADTLRDATLVLHRLCIQAAHHVAERDDLLELFGIPAAWRGFVRASLRRNDPSLYGRLDLAFDGAGPPQLLEYNADTPTSLIESAAAQWHWLADTHPGQDQFNLLHERLIARLRAIRTAASQPGTAAPILHLSSVDDAGEDQQTALYLQDVAIQAGWDARFVALADVGWSERDQHFVGIGGERIRAWFKLYPWEWAAQDPFGAHLPHQDMLILEPAWKMLLSNKALLPVLWRLFPGHPNLLPASFDAAGMSGSYVAKPTLSREGANVTLHDGQRTLAETGGPYAGARRVYQQAARLFQADGRHAVLGSWIVGDSPAGLIVREDRGPIITNASQVVPHLVKTSVP